MSRNDESIPKTSKRIAILQPGYLPWLGFFDQMYKSDIFVIYDDVQYTKRSWRNRNKIKTKDGWIWLTVPVITKGEFKQRIFETKIDNSRNWRKKHWRSLEIWYQKAPYFKKYKNFFENLYSKKWEYLVDLDLEIIKYLTEVLGIKTPTVRSSKFRAKGKGTEHVVNICKEVGANLLYDGKAAKGFIDEDLMKRNRIEIEYQDYQHPVYSQLYGQFVPYLSVIDLMFNCGKESLDILVDKKENAAQR